VLGETTGSYHGVFAATGTLKFYIFHEAEQRGEEEQANAQLTALRQREADLRVTIDAQIRASMLDVQSSYQQVQVAQSNVTLAQQELSDERDRFSAGIDTNLPVEDAEASVTGAQAQLVQALLQYNLTKLQLARNTGIIETRYRAYLGK
jgi:outer membrane protein TolC